MREIRQNLITKDWVIFATDRGKRPHEFADPQFPEPTSLPQYKASCPFCVGNAFHTRYQQIRHDHRIEAIVIFKNHGVKAGTSLEHPHSQLAGLPIVPFQFRMRVDEAIRYFDDHGSCLFCDTITDELHCGDRIITTTEFFTAFIPYAALSPFHIWIFPLRHTSSFEDITDAEIADFSP